MVHGTRVVKNVGYDSRATDGGSAASDASAVRLAAGAERCLFSREIKAATRTASRTDHLRPARCDRDCVAPGTASREGDADRSEWLEEATSVLGKEEATCGPRRLRTTWLECT